LQLAGERAAGVLADIRLERRAREVVPFTEYIAQRSQEYDDG
jgi:hypothetical protein